MLPGHKVLVFVINFALYVFSRDNFNEAVSFVGSLPTQTLRRKNRAALFYCLNETYVTSENDF